MTIGVADVMKYFNQGIMQWWGWEDTSAGEVYSNLKLLDDTATMPTEDEINDKIAEIQVQEDRKNAYPAIADQLDWIWHLSLIHISEPTRLLSIADGGVGV